MSHLAPCPVCNRHVDIAESACPFCAAALPASFRARPPLIPLRGRLGRAALMTAGAALMGAAACSSNDAIGVEKNDATPSYDGMRVVAAYGAPIVLGTGGAGGAGGNVGSGGNVGNVGTGGAVSTGGAGGVTDAGSQGATDAATDTSSAGDASQDRTFIAIYGAPFTADKQPNS
jgi:hypothetical protein